MIFCLFVIYFFVLQIKNAYNAAKSNHTWNLRAYAMSNNMEYFAQGACAWFNADHGDSMASYVH